jgi:lysophospholipase L1-like esterase
VTGNAGGTFSGAGGVGASAVAGSGGSSHPGALASGGQAGFGVAGTIGSAGTAGFAGTAGMSSGGASGAGGSGFGGGSGNGSGGIAAGGSSGYQPCPTNGDPCKILPLGDSITWGIQYDGAYRVQLFSKAVAAHQKITFTGSLSNGPNTVAGMPFPKHNEGHSGWTIAQDASLVPSPAFDTLPNIVLLMIGTNDVYAPSGQAAMPDRLGALMDKIFAAAPNALLVVAKITPLANAGSASTIQAYNDAIPGLVQARAAAGKHVLMADMNAGFTKAMLSNDGVHPNQSGYDFMGNAWYAVISSLLPQSAN